MRCRSASISLWGTWFSATGRSPLSTICAGPMAMPGDTARPGSRCSAPLLCGAEPVTSSILIKFAFDELGERRHRRLGFGTGGGEPDDRAGGGGQHHQAHDRAAGNFGTVLAHPDFSV